MFSIGLMVATKKISMEDTQKKMRKKSKHVNTKKNSESFTSFTASTVRNTVEK